MTDLIKRIEATPADASSETLRKLSDDGLAVLGLPQQSHTVRHNPAASVDDCLKLVGDGWRISHAYWNPAKGEAVFVLTRDRDFMEGKASTPALALLIAILKAEGHVQE